MKAPATCTLIVRGPQGDTRRCGRSAIAGTKPRRCSLHGGLDEPNLPRQGCRVSAPYAKRLPS